jgi:hypothetical protein
LTSMGAAGGKRNWEGDLPRIFSHDPRGAAKK